MIRRQGSDAMKALIRRWQADQTTPACGLSGTAQSLLQWARADGAGAFAVRTAATQASHDAEEDMGFLRHERRPYL
jgi:hypothetical protein